MKKLLSIFLALAIVIGLLPAIAGFANAAEQADHVIIHAAFGGGGNSGAPYKNDYIVLYNPTNAAVSLNGWSIQYASKTGSFSSSNTTNLSGTIAAGGYYLIQEAGSGTAANLPTPNATGSINMSAKEFKLALVQGTSTISGKNDSKVVDFLGVNSSANEYEGTGAAPAGSNTTEVVRKQLGVDTDNNAADFTTGTPDPKNGSSGSGSGSENQGGGTETPTVTPDGYTYTKVTASSELTSGYYTMVTSQGQAPLVLDGTWVTKATPVFSNNELVNSNGAIWHLEVTGNTVKITDKNNVKIAPKTGNDNGIQSGSYDWAWTFADGTFKFSGQGDDTTTFAQNGTSGFRAYKNTTVSGNTTTYLTEFTLYKVEGYTPPEPSQGPELGTIAQALAAASGDFKVKGVVTFIDGKNIYIQDETGAICIYANAAATDLAVGDTIIATGEKTVYNGLPELKSATYEKSTGITLSTLKETNKVSDITLDYLCNYVQLTATVKSVTDNKIVLTDGTNDIDWHKPVVTNLGIKAGDIVTVKGAVGVYNNKAQLRNTNADEITIVCSYDASKMTWTADDNGHQATCSVCSQIHVKCSTALQTVKTDDTHHWDECPSCDFATSKVPHSMSAQKDADHHWTACTCGKATEKIPHSLVYATDNTHHWIECSGCEYSTEANKAAHDFGTTYQKDEDNHWLECECGKENDKGAHNDGDDADKLCDKCGLDMSCTHANGYEWTKDATHHWEKCKDCGLEKPDSKVAHTMDNQHDADKHWSVCTNTNCGHATEKVEHDLEAKSNDTHRWQECKDCDYATEKEALPQSSNVLASGNYVLVDANGNAPLILDSGWLTFVAPTVTGGAVTDAKGAVWTLTVDGDTVILKDSNGTVIAPKGGNNNGIKEGDYKWKVVKNADGTYSFLGQGDDTVILASNTDPQYGGNKYRAYKTSTVSNYPDSYPCNFTLYPVTVSDDDSNDNNNENDNTGDNTGDSTGGNTGGNTGDSTGGNTGDSTEKIDSIKDALAGQKNDVFTVTGVVNLIDGKNVYIQDATGGICIYLSAAPEGLKLGDTITATGKRDTYNGLPELVQGTYEKVADGALELKPADKTLETLTAADVGTYVTLKDLVVVEVFDNDGAYTAPNITVQDAKGNKIQIYKAQVSKVGENWSVKVGDKLTVTASVGIYKETLQLRNTVAGEIVVQTANSSTGDIFGVIVAMMAISGMGLTAVLTKKH